jgi:N-acyl-phosphatidylethanolamine-hydrolysing phospholipase D
VGRRLSLFLLLGLATASPGAGTEAISGQPGHHVSGGFTNTNPEYRLPGAWARWTFIARRAFASVVSPRQFIAPRVPNDGRGLRAGSGEPTVTWVGHSTLLVQLDGLNVLTDPNWGFVAGPLSWIGPRRLSPPGLAFEDLPRIDLVLISHDHYDHLDRPTVMRLHAAHHPLFLVPLGLKAWMADQGITRVEELDWWDTRELGGLRFVCAPAQHFSQRAFWDRNSRLWASWVLLGRSRRFYFGGDTGYFDGFRQVGERFGPFDLSAIAIGAYMPATIMRWNHTTPEQAVRAFEDLRSRTLLGIHWGTFDLAEEPLDEPPRRMLAEVARRGIDPSRAWILAIGETRRW